MRFRAVSTVLSLSLLAIPLGAQAEVGKHFASELRVMPDKVTGRPLTLLTNGTFHDAKMYQTDQQWAFDGKHIVFRSTNRSPDGRSQIFSIDEKTGDIVQLTDGPGVNISSIMVSRLRNEVYYLRKGDDGRLRINVIELTPLIADAMAGHVSPKGYERVVATLPEGFVLSGGFTLDADGKTAYVGFRDQAPPPPPPETANASGIKKTTVVEGPGGLIAVDLATGATRPVVHTTFTVGHIQANPFKSGEILYCHETGGDTDYRIWIVNADGSGNRPVYNEGPDDWVTHEQFADADHIIFNLMGHTVKLRQRPSGLMVVSLRDGTMENLGQVPIKMPEPITTPRDEPNSFWHNGVTYDGKYAAGDDFDGNVWLIDRTTHNMTRLTTGHLMRPDHTHPSFSADDSRILIQSGMLTSGKRLSLILVPVNWKAP